VGKYPVGATADEKTALLTALGMLASDAAAIISEATSIEFVESQKYGTINVFESFMGWISRQYATAILGQTGTSQAISTGMNSGVADVHNEVRHDLSRADAKALECTWTDQFLRPLVGFNFGWDAPVPRWKIAYEPESDYAALGQKYTALQGLGFPLTKKRIAEVFDEPLPEADDELLTAPAPANPFAGFGGAATTAAMKEELRQDKQDLQDKNAGVKTEALAALVAPVEALLAESGSLAEFKEKLLAWGAEQGPAALEGFGNVVAKAITAAELQGRFEVRKSDGG
jgi:phage gp29-like protein